MHRNIVFIHNYKAETHKLENYYTKWNPNKKEYGAAGKAGPVLVLIIYKGVT